MRRRLDKNLHRFRPWTQGQINDLGFPEPESSDLSARASPPKFLIPTLRKPRRVGQPQLGGAKGAPARPGLITNCNGELRNKRVAQQACRLFPNCSAVA